jgi:apolipoprotein N-acyltransferase
MKAKKKPAQAGGSRRTEPILKRILFLAAAPVSGALVTLCFPPFSLHFIAWIALAPFLYSIERTNGRGAVLRGYLFGVAYFASLFWWLTVVRYPAPLGYACFVVLIPVIFIPWAWISNRLMQRGAPLFRVWLPAALWIVFERAMSYGTFALPWWSLGNTQTANPVVAQLAAIGSIYLISLLVLLVNFFFISLFARRSRRELPVWIALGLAVVFTIAYGAACLSRKPRLDRPVRAALVQASFNQEEKVEQVELGRLFFKHIEMTDQAVAERRPDLVVWPETITPLVWINGPGNLEPFMRRMKLWNAPLIAGVYDWPGGKSYNSVVAIDPEKGITGKYDKVQLVPFGEMFPYRKLVERISPWAGRWIVKNVYEEDTTRGAGFKTLDTRLGKFGVMICFESVFPQIARRMTSLGAEYLLVVTNDAWFKKTAGTYQHADMARLRAIENRRYLMQSANSGVTSIIDPYGRIVAETGVFDRTILYGTIYPQRGLSFYTRFGDITVWLCLALSIAGIAYYFLTRKTPARPPAEPAPKKKIQNKKQKR